MPQVGPKILRRLDTLPNAVGGSIKLLLHKYQTKQHWTLFIVCITTARLSFFRNSACNLHIALEVDKLGEESLCPYQGSVYNT
jgi:hypothetical protein